MSEQLIAIAVEDEPKALEIIELHVKKIPFLTLQRSFRDALAAISWLQDNQVDLVFLDINMPSLSGLKFREYIGPNPMIIFTTAYEEYALKAFDLCAIDYLLKPIDPEELELALEKFFQLQNKSEPVSTEQLDLLIRIDAFRFTGTNKHELLWKAHLFLGKQKRIDHPKLFPPKRTNFQLPKLDTTFLETAFEQWELLGFPLCSPFELLKERPLNQNGQGDLQHYLNRRIDIYGYLVTVKNTSTHTGKRMHFATLLDQQGKVFDTVLFPPVAAKYPFRGRGVYRFYGKVVSEFGFLSIEVIRMKKEDYIQDPRYADMKTSRKQRQSLY